MGDSTQNSEQPKGQLSAEDLGLIPDSLEDEVKTDEEIWAEIETQETAAVKGTEANGEDLAGDKPAVDADADASADASASAAGSEDSNEDRQAGEASSNQEDEGDQGAGDAQSAADKLWSGANDEQRAAFAAGQAQIKKLEQSDRSNRGRVSTLQRQVNDITKQLDRAAKAPGDKLGAADAGTAAKGFLASKDWKDFEGEYPEVAGPLGKVITELQTQVTNASSRQDAIDDDRHLDDVHEQTDILLKEHPDWLDTATDDAFGPWLEDQPRHIQEAAVRNAKEIVDAREAADVVSRFKAFRSEQSEGSAGPGNAGDEPGDQETGNSLTGKRQRQLDSAAGARPRGAGAATGIPEDGDPQALWDAFDRQDERAAAAR